jgi:hypothetical protein
MRFRLWRLFDAYHADASRVCRVLDGFFELLWWCPNTIRHGESSSESKGTSCLTTAGLPN